MGALDGFGGGSQDEHEELVPLTSRQGLSGSEDLEDARDVFRGPAEESWYAHRTAKTALVAAAAAGCALAVYFSPIAVAARSHGAAGALESLVSANFTAENWGQDCWTACSGPGLCPDFCGLGNACCRFQSAQDPPECHGILAWGSLTFHTCVIPTNIVYQVTADAPPGVKNWGQDCFSPCYNKSGYCNDFCGQGNACCRWNSADPAPECAGIAVWGSKDRHTCVAVADPTYQVALTPPEGSTVLHWGKPCLASCETPGYCQEYCGMGNACCHWTGAGQAPECSGILAWGIKDNFTCVAPVHAHYQVAQVGPPGVLNWGGTCEESCGGPGYCQEYCGMGNACCKWQAGTYPPECAGITIWGSKDRYTCVKPESAAYVTAAAPIDSQVLNWGQDCLPSCNASGLCGEFCGAGNACCRWSAQSDAPECHGVTLYGAKDRYTCVAPVAELYKLAASPYGVEVNNWGKDCWTACGETGGACPGFCGVGNACCRFQSTKDPPECHGIVAWGSKEEHTCVAPTAPYLFVNHFAEDCWQPCNGAGYCEDWCGQGNACCRFGRSEDPHECHGVTYWPTHDAHTCVKALGRYGAIPLAPAANACTPGQVHNAAGTCVPADHPALMTFYLYYATNDEATNLNNVNLGNLEAVLMYVHRHVVTACPRKGTVNRVIRYAVSVRNTEALFNATQDQFAEYTKFENGACVGSDTPCSNEWDKYGYVVGCQGAESSNPQYGHYAGATFYSLPSGGNGQAGECVNPSGDWKCTWRADYAGELRLDEISGINDVVSFCNVPGNIEYNETIDAGNGTKFWDNRRSADWCARRLHYVKELFKMRYPSYPIDLGQPACSH